MAQLAAGTAAGTAIGTTVGGPPGAVIGACIGGGLAAVSLIGALIAHTRNKAKQIKKEAKQKKDPKFFKEQIEKLTEEFIVDLEKLQFSSKIQKKSNLKDVMFLGATSAGKTSLINSLFKTKHAIGLGVTTSQVTLAFEDEEKRIWDAVGQNSDFQFFDFDDLGLIHSMDLICIVYQNTPKIISKLIKLICLYKNPKYQFVFVRTGCDQWTMNHSKSIDEEIQEDVKILTSFGVKNVKIFKTSGKEGGYENEKLKSLM